MDTNTAIQPGTAPGAQNAPAPPASPGTKRRRPGRRKKIIKNIVAILISLGIVGALVWLTYIAFYQPAPEFYLTQRIDIWDVPIKNILYGDGPLAPIMSETVTLTESGTVLEANAYYGMNVMAGDVLVALDTSSIDEAVAEHEEDIADIENSIANSNDQIAKAEESIAKLYADLADANAEQIALAQAARLYAPFSGQIVEAERLIIGQEISHGMPLARLIDDSQMTLTLYFSYGYENDIYLGQPCEVSVPSVMSTVAGKVTGIEKIRRIGADGSVTFEVTITMDNPGALVSQAAATASMITADGETILPSDSGVLECIREELLVMESHGPLKVNNLRNYYDVREGDLLAELDFQPDSTIEDIFMEQIEGQQASIEGYQNTIDGYNDQILGIRAQIDLEYERMDDLVIRSPIDGQISSYNDIYPGMTISATGGMPISITVSQMDTLVLEGTLYQSDVQKVEVGMPVDILYNTEPISGTLTSIDRTANENMGQGMGAYYPVTISVDNSMGMLMVGAYASFEVVLETSIDNPIIVPIQAIKAIGEDEYIFLKPQDGERPESAVDWPDEDDVPPGFYAIPVECGIQDRRYIEITEGIPVEWKGWEVFTAKSETPPSPLPSYDFEVEISDPEERAAFDDGYEKGYEDALNASPSPGEGDGYYDDFGNWVPGDGSDPGFIDPMPIDPGDPGLIEPMPGDDIIIDEPIEDGEPVDDIGDDSGNDEDASNGMDDSEEDENDEDAEEDTEGDEPAADASAAPIDDGVIIVRPVRPMPIR